MSEMKNIGSMLSESHPSEVGAEPWHALDLKLMADETKREREGNSGEDAPEVALRKEEVRKNERKREERMNATEGYFKNFTDEKVRELKEGKVDVVQSDIDGETEKIMEIKSSIAEKKSVEKLREEVERLKESYHMECERQIEYRKKKSGILERIKTLFFIPFFLPKDKSSSEQLNTIFLDEQVKKSRSAYMDAKKELEKYEGVEREA